MSAEIRTLKDGETQVLPRTKAKAVSTEDGDTVENKLGAISSIKPIQFTTESKPLQFSQDQIKSIMDYSPLIVAPYTYEDPAVGGGPEPDPVTYNAVFVPYLKDENTVTYISHLEKRNIMLNINVTSMIGEIKEIGASFLPDPDYYDKGKYVVVDSNGISYELKDIEIPSNFDSNIKIKKSDPAIVFDSSSPSNPSNSASISFAPLEIKEDDLVSISSYNNSILMPAILVKNGVSGYAISCSGLKINGVGDPEDKTDAVSKGYVDNLILGAMEASY